MKLNEPDVFVGTHCTVRVPRAEPGQVQCTHKLGQSYLQMQLDDASRKKKHNMALQDERQKAAREAKQEADDMVIYKPPGESLNIVTSDSSNEVFGDDDMFIINEHVDPALVAKIKRGENVDLAKLLPMEKKLYDDGRLQMINKDRMSYFMPGTEKDPFKDPINCFKQWEQAFGIYTNIYLLKNPNRAVETLQYSHSIREAATRFVWDDEYHYDCCFRSNPNVTGARFFTRLGQFS